MYNLQYINILCFIFI